MRPVGRPTSASASRFPRPRSSYRSSTCAAPVAFAQRTCFDKIVQRNHRIGVTGVWTAGTQTLTFGGHSHVDAVRFESNPTLPMLLFFTGRDSLNGPIASPSQVLQPASSRGIQGFAYAWADFLLGRVDNFLLAGVSRAEMRSRSMALFLEHAWRTTERLSLTTGVRYELTGIIARSTARREGRSFLATSRINTPTRRAGWPGPATAGSRRSFHRTATIWHRRCARRSIFQEMGAD